ncbi:adenylosuccinate lyase [Theileria orientalis]|uniref:Adenylosuccinate lyase n=1 Tax=Theileria orientalis TaxID=68886 RepID=A0A976QUV9_THEOR|nr:adenylosuccinate lyase [Theileria orientalis]
MFELRKFEYDFNCKIFGIELGCESTREEKEIEKFIGSAINGTEELLKLSDNVFSQRIKDPTLQQFLRSFVCLAFPPYSPYVPYDEILIENPMHTNINVISRNVFNLFLKASKCTGNDTLCKLGFSDPKFMLNILNMYGRNNEKLVNRILKCSNLVNGRFVEDMVSVTHSLFQILGDSYEYLRSLVNTFMESTASFQQIAENSILADRQTGTDYSKVFVNSEHMMLDVVSYLEIALKFTPDALYSSLLSKYVETPYGNSTIEQVVTNCYYLLLYVHKLMVETREPIYEIKKFHMDSASGYNAGNTGRYKGDTTNGYKADTTSGYKTNRTSGYITDGTNNSKTEYTTRFQICVYYRCRILLIKLLLMIVRFNITASPGDSGEYCYNWLLIFIKIGGDQYNVDRDLILEDLNEINLPIYIDEWDSINKNWSQNEINQMKSLVVNKKDKSIEQNIVKIKEITQIEDDDTIRNCLTKHENDVDSTIMDLINNFTSELRKIFNCAVTPKPAEIGKKGVEKLSLSYVPTESKQAVMNYWQYINENADMYNDDNEEEEEIPINVNLNIDDLPSSEEQEQQKTEPRGKNFYRNKQYHKAHYGNHYRRDSVVGVGDKCDTFEHFFKMLERYKAVSPVDGRYNKYTFEISEYLSEYSITKNRILVEVRWLQCLIKLGITPVKQLSNESVDFLESLTNVTEKDLQTIIDIETKFMHDLKAVEYYIRKRLEESGHPELNKLVTWVHILCTSEDINSPSYSIGIRDCMNNIMKPLMLEVINALTRVALENADKVMLSRTHGQPAVPTTFGKEVATFVYRLSYQYKKNIQNIEYFGKFGGAVGNYNVHTLIFPDMDWESILKNFVEELGLTYQPYTKQIECHDYISELADSVSRFNTILKDLCMDFWLYQSRGLLKLKNVKGEVGSSTMPHKINPIALENAEGNLGVANCLFQFFSSKLPRSRMQRDLSDSSVLRNLGVAFGHSVVAYKNILTSLERMGFNEEASGQDIQEHWTILSEPLQVSLKMMGHKDAFEKVMVFTRGVNPTKEEMLKFIEESCGKDSMLMTLKLEDYTGLAEKLARNVVNYVPKE